MAKHQDHLKDIFDELRDEYLDDNDCEFCLDKVPYGDAWVDVKTGYRDSDWQRATDHAKNELMRLTQEIINNH